MSKTLITDDRIDAMIALAHQTPEGMMAECGVYKGGSILRLAQAFPARNIIGFDTFTGLPVEQWNKNEPHQPGDFNDTSLISVHEYVCGENNCLNVYFKQGIFPATTKGLEHTKFSFVHVDFDFYEGIKAALKFFWPRLLPGGIMVFDDFRWPNCPGVEKALLEFGEPIHESAEYQAYLINQ